MYNEDLKVWRFFKANFFYRHFYFGLNGLKRSCFEGTFQGWGLTTAAWRHYMLLQNAVFSPKFDII